MAAGYADQREFMHLLLAGSLRAFQWPSAWRRCSWRSTAAGQLPLKLPWTSRGQLGCSCSLLRMQLLHRCSAASCVGLMLQLGINGMTCQAA